MDTLERKVPQVPQFESKNLVVQKLSYVFQILPVFPNI